MRSLDWLIPVALLVVTLAVFWELVATTPAQGGQ